MSLLPSAVVTPAADSPLTPWPVPGRGAWGVWATVGDAVGDGGPHRVQRRNGRAGATIARVAAVSARGVYLLLPASGDAQEADSITVSDPDSDPVSAVGSADDHGAAVIPILTADALALPTAVRLGRRSGDIDWGVAVGDPVTVAARRTRHGVLGWGVDLPDAQIRVVRRWSPARVSPVAFGTRLDVDVEGSRAALRDDVAAVVRVATTGGDPGPLVRSLLGAGPGLTPSGDDALAGALLVLHALGLFAPLARAIRGNLARTTALSASLLSVAMDGYAVPAVVAFVDAVLAGDPPAAARARPVVEAMGHWSGGDLIAGVAGALVAVQTLRAAAARDVAARFERPAPVDRPGLPPWLTIADSPAPDPLTIRSAQ